MKAPSPLSVPRTDTASAFARFPTTIGECLVFWNERGLTAFALPGSTDPAASATPDQPSPEDLSASPPAEVAAVIARIQRHLSGELQDFSDLSFDWSRVTPFRARVLRALLAIGPGRTATYGALAQTIGAPAGSARAIGGAVGANPWPLLVPCHRILGANGKLTGFSAPGGIATKSRLLALEGVELAT
ncbi:MAG TPA: methylated-DNA--[protein]-cysteine S-methyltransferase [Opitutaceae bacterium]|nr:methylated-DNA--[protein]-cysteine S-methyltransferase [Opitutaceae bacterium]